MRGETFALNEEIRFEYFLARELGMTVAQMRLNMSVREFQNWKFFYEVEQKERQIALEKAKREQKAGTRVRR